MQKNKLTKNIFYNCCYVFFSCLLIACDSDKLGGNEKPIITKSATPSSTYFGEIKIDLTAAPEINIDPDSETTEIILQFIPRTKEGFPLNPEQVNVTLLLDEQDIDPEARIASSAQQLAFNINFGLVLDASYSMIISHGTDAFTPMLTSAKNSVQTGVDIWAEREGTFSFHTTWFNSSIYSSLDNSSRQWTAEDLMFIPQPREGDYTRLFSATHYAIENMAEMIAAQEQGPRDQNIILVFSDGADNYSWHDDSQNAVVNFTTENDVEYLKLGYVKTDLDRLIETIKNQKNLSIHVIGLGEKINVTDLQAIATAGNGLYLENPDAREIGKPFQRIIQEFTTLQTHGAKMPLQPGEYKFTLRVEDSAGSNPVDYSFQFKTGDDLGEVIPENTEQ